MLYSWGMVRDTLMSESLMLAGRRLVAAHCKKGTFLFDIFNSLVWNSLNLPPDLRKRLMTLNKESHLNFSDMIWTWYFGALIFCSWLFFPMLWRRKGYRFNFWGIWSVAKRTIFLNCQKIMFYNKCFTIMLKVDEHQIFAGKVTQATDRKHAF